MESIQTRPSLIINSMVFILTNYCSTAYPDNQPFHQVLAINGGNVEVQDRTSGDIQTIPVEKVLTIEEFNKLDPNALGIALPIKEF